MEDYPKHSDEDAAWEANEIAGPGWLFPIASELVIGFGEGGYIVMGVSGIIYAETALGAVTAVVLTVRALVGSEDEEKAKKFHWYVPIDREEDRQRKR